MLATGERGLGYQAVFGSQPLNVRQFELFSHIQERLAQLSTEEGRKQIEMDVDILIADELEEEERLAAGHRREAAAVDHSAYDAEAEEFMRIQAELAARGLT